MLVPFIDKDGKERDYNLAHWTARQLDRVKKLIAEKDRDFLMVICGDEGSGKSLLASEICYYVDRTFDESRMCLTPQAFIDAINKCSKGQAICFDEAYTGLSSTGTMSSINKVLREYLMEMRKKNLFVVLCIPSFFYLDRYCALHRARALFRTYFIHGKPGAYMCYNRKKMKLLYLYGKRKLSYKYPRVSIKNRFPNIAPIDWDAYEDRKIDSLKNKKEISPRQKKWLDQRNAALYLIRKKTGATLRQLAVEMTQLGVPTAFQDISKGEHDLEVLKPTP